jgi:hypothetical protein
MVSCIVVFMRSGASVLGLVAALDIVLACGKGKADRGQPITEQQRVLVLTAVQGLRQSLDHSPCGNFLDVAVEQRREDWMEQCQYIRETWGDWRSFSANYWYRPAS